MSETSTEVRTPSVKERLSELTAGIEKGIQELFQSEKYAQYLRTMSRFHRYSLNNTLLIFLQKPDATLVAGFNRWRDQFTRNVMRGEKAIRIIAPMPKKKTVETQRVDPKTREPVLDQDGNPMTVQKVVTIPFFRPVSVFDVSQTAGKPLPQLANDLTGDVAQYDAFLEALRRSSPVPIEIGTVPPHVDGFFSDSDKRIVLKEGMSQVQTISTALHELTHARLHTKEQLAIDRREESALRKDRGTREVEAESVAYAVCAYFGIATQENSFGYIATWSKDKDLPELKASLETINRTASDIISDIDRNMAEIRKERGLDAHEQETKPTPDKDSLLPEQALSAPDPHMPEDALLAVGYTDQDMHPLSRERALELFAQGLPVYLLSEGNAQSLATRSEEITNHTGICGITRQDWQAAAVPDMKVQDTKDTEQQFKDSRDNVFLIYQIPSGEEGRDLRFRPYSEVQSDLNPAQYQAMQIGVLPSAPDIQSSLNTLYARFNEPLPWNTGMRSLSVGDVIAIKQQGQVSCHYVDITVFVELPGFLSSRNPLRALEDMLEQNDNQLDGIINNTPAPKEPVKPVVPERREAPQREAAAKEAPEQRKSVLAQLRKSMQGDTPMKHFHQEQEAHR